jgi:mannosyltransferase OCH1-like enzyme
MIPKIIHYCWFGADMPAHLQINVDKWKELMPDYQFMYWSNNHLNEYSVKFFKQAKGKKHYAFVSDYFRLRKVHEYGGFYLDTDMLLLRPLDDFLAYEFVICSEVTNRPNWAFFGACEGNVLIQKCFMMYHEMEYDQFKPPVIPYFLKDEVLNYIIESPKQRINLNPDYFYPMPVESATENHDKFITSNTYGIHLWDFSWIAIKKNRSLTREVFFRIYVLTKDLFSLRYSPYYFRINVIRIGRLLKQGRLWKRK